MKNKKKDLLFEKRIEFYSWLKDYEKKGNSISDLKILFEGKHINEMMLPLIIKPKIALIIINDYLAVNKPKTKDTQLSLYQLYHA